MIETNNKIVVNYLVDQTYKNLFVSIIFAVALILCIVYITISHIRARKKFTVSMKEILAGICMGTGNVLYSLLILKALESLPAATVFAASAVGVVFVVAIIGRIAFKEQLSLRQKVALGITIISLWLVNQ